ncbi:MAG TPA: hypothetical protein VF173_21785 [Thermoanaerobaculia bacterium]|nr:hypothetical protein [Thermoanaerobaculia bacterium]
MSWTSAAATAAAPLDTTCCAGPAASPWSVSQDERAVLDSVDLYLRRGLDLKRWWDQACAANSFAQKFPLTVSFNRPDESFGFFDVARVDGRDMPIMGNYQSLFYDQPKSPVADKVRAAQWVRDQLRQFVLRYFMRISHFRLPEAFIANAAQPRVPAWLRPLSWCPKESPSQVGFGFSQFFSKQSANGAIRGFPESDRYQIVDLRRIGPELAWLLPSVRIFDFKFSFQPFGPGTPSLVLPLNEGSYLVMNRDFVIDEDEPTPDLLGRYGFGYAFIKNPRSGLLSYGPGEFDAAIEIIRFTVDRAGRIRAEAIFVANRPSRVASLSLNPLDWGYEAANLLTLGASRYFLAPFKRAWESLPGSSASFDPVRLLISTASLMTAGLAARDFCVSLEQLERDFLVIHFQQHNAALVGSLETWRQVSDWLASEDELPSWVVTGRSG